MNLQRVASLGGMAFLFFFFFATKGFSAVQASVVIEQLSGTTVGAWTLLSSNGGSTHTSTDTDNGRVRAALALTEFGPTTLSVTIPQGMSVKISVYRGGTLVESVETPQYSFNLLPNDSYRFIVQYSLSRLGSLGVTSLPSGLRFRLKSESGRTRTATTPFTFTGLPAGRYSVHMSTLRGCLQPALQSAVVMPEERSAIHVTMNCDKTETTSTAATVRGPSKRSLVEYARKREFKRRGERK